MNPITFSNAMVGTVAAYAEVVAEQARTIEQRRRSRRPTPPERGRSPGYLTAYAGAVYGRP